MYNLRFVSNISVDETKRQVQSQNNLHLKGAKLMRFKEIEALDLLESALVSAALTLPEPAGGDVAGEGRREFKGSEYFDADARAARQLKAGSYHRITICLSGVIYRCMTSLLSKHLGRVIDCD